ncbi:MAG: DUF302 domain-containing protein [Betaproteobacteria bacterium]|nr:DUF302 domain-containing protein [Betaproteobacteria bacterium]
MKALAILLLLLTTTFCQARDVPHPNLFRVTVNQPFSDVMNEVQIALEKEGYHVLRVQRVDYGLKVSGYKSNLYRIVFFGRSDVKAVMQERPDLLPYLPLTITLYREAGMTHLVAMSPLVVARGGNPNVAAKAALWDADIRKVFAEFGWKP